MGLVLGKAMTVLSLGAQGGKVRGGGELGLVNTYL